MREIEVRVAGQPAIPVAGWRLEWIDRERGVARIVTGEGSATVLIEGAGTEWAVTIAGRRIPVSVLSWRERLMAEAADAGRVHGGPLSVTATLPGLVVAVRVAVGDEVAEGAALVTIEAMKMQNEVRAPRGGRVRDVAVAAGQAVGTGAPLLTLE